MQNFVKKKNRTRIVQVTFIRGANKKMNSSELEKISLIESIPKETEIKAPEHPIYCIEYLTTLLWKLEGHGKNTDWFM